jgi:hypothetical protein
MADVAGEVEDLIEETTEKLLGVGLGKALSIAIFTMIIIVMLKVIFTRYPITGISEFVNAV